MTDKLIIFRKERFEWADPWGKVTDEQVLRVVYILRPETDESIRRFEFTIDPGYGRENIVKSHGYNIPLLGEVRRYTDPVSYSGGSWWRFMSGADLVAHDKDTFRRERLRVLDMWGRPRKNPFEPLDIQPQI